MKKALVVILVLAAVIAGYLAYAGAFKKVTVAQQKMGPYNLLYVEQKGDYGQTGKTCSVVADALKALEINPEYGFGIYYDNPRNVKKADLRADVGMVISSKDLRKAAKLKKQFKSRNMAAQECLVTELPFKGGISIYIGIIKAYPALMKAAEDKKLKIGAIMELYDIGKTITYVLPVKK